MTDKMIDVVMDDSAIEQVLISGDLSKLSPKQRVQYYQKVCSSLGLNPFTKPFEYITLNGKLTLYAKKDATDQLRNLQSVSIDDVDIVETATQFIVKVKGHNRDGRTDVEVGVVNKTDMQGNTANAQMKVVTKSKRRLTLSLCGLGWLDETEIEAIPSARPVTVIPETGEIVNGLVQEAKRLAETPTPRPMKPEQLLETIQNKVKYFEQNPSDKFKDAWKKSIVMNIEREVSEYVEDKTAVRRAILNYLVGKEHSADLTQAEATALWGWLGVHKDGDLWDINADTKQEIDSLVRFLAPQN